MNQPEKLTTTATWSDVLDTTIAKMANMAPAAGADLLDRILAECPDGRGRGLNDALVRQIPKLRDVLPDNLKDQAERFVKIAMMTFSKRDELQDCTPSSYLRCVFDAAQYGFAIDGRLFHAVSRWSKEKGCKEASCMPDYKGLIAVAKRCGAILECEARNVFKGDEFSLWFEDGRTHFTHKPAPAETGEYIGTYCRVWVRQAPEWLCDFVPAKEVGAIMQRSEGFKRGKGPWVTDLSEMRKKTAIKRLLKTRVDDPAFSQLLEIDDREYERIDPEQIQSGQPVKATSTLGKIADALGPTPDEPESFPQGTEPASTTTESAPPQSIDDDGEEPDLSEEPGPDGDEANLDNLRNSLTGCSARWEVEDVASGYKDVFVSESAKVQGRNIVKAAYARCTPEVAPAKGKKQKQAFPTSSGTGV